MADELQVTEQTEEQKEPELNRKNGGAKASLFIAFLALIIVLCAAVFGYLSMTNAKRSLKHSIRAMKQQIATNQAAMQAIQHAVKENAQLVQTSKALADEQTRLIADWRAAQQGNLAKWQAAEAQYLVNLANDQLQYNADPNMAKILLQKAEQTLNNLQDPQLMAIQKSIAADLASLTTLPQNDVTNLYIQVLGLDKQIDQLTFPMNPLVQQSNQSPMMQSTANLSWWQAGLQKAWQGLQQIVIVRKTGSEAPPITLPEEKTFLYQNLHAQMSNIMWAILHHNNTVFQASIENAMSWIKQYFAQDNDVTKNLISNLGALQKINLEPTSINFAATLKLFDDFFNATNKEQETLKQ